MCGVWRKWCMFLFRHCLFTQYFHAKTIIHFLNFFKVKNYIFFRYHWWKIDDVLKLEYTNLVNDGACFSDDCNRKDIPR